MSNVLFLGPFIDSVDEAAPLAGPTPSHATVAFRSPATDPGGNVHLAIVVPVPPAPIYPQFVHAIYIPKGQETALVAAGDPQAFLSSSFPQGRVQCLVGPGDNTAALDISVSGITPGLHFLQTVLEYAS